MSNFNGDDNMSIQSSNQFLERRLTTLFGTNSKAIKALDLVKEEMCVERGFKRDNGTDYYNHCIEVANTLISFCIKDENVICAALLHDIVEDVEGYTGETIKRMFNERVAELVMLVTKKPEINYREADNLKAYLSRILQDRDASAIKTSDRMHNMMTLEEKSFEARYNKAMETKIYYLPFFRECSIRYPRYENLFDSARSQIDPLIFHIESFYEEIRKLREQLENNS